MVRAHLEQNYPTICRSFSEVEGINSDRLLSEAWLSRQAGGFAFDYWCRGGDLHDVESLLVAFDTILGRNEAIGQSLSAKNSATARQNVFQEVMLNVEHVSTDPAQDIWAKPLLERQAHVQKWRHEIGIAKVIDQAVEIHRRHQDSLGHQDQNRADTDTRLLGQQDVIGLTTTACAKFWPLLSKLELRTVICEEAGEVIEAHSLCTLFSSVKHAIFIGDPLQLRAQVQELEMAIENNIQYRLDQSLFERMMQPSLREIRPFETSRLNIQRRAHPMIANIMRATLYPNLKDSSSTQDYPRVAGMAERLYWLDHRHPEVRPDPRSQFATSYANPFEVEMISAMIQYLVSTNEYNFGDIAVLTPYNGQLEALKQQLQKSCSIWLIEKDKEALLDLNAALDVDMLDRSATEEQDGKMTFDMSNMLRLATVDNFQGEEAKIVILSTVRSNIDDRVGFLKTFNRINVACSRAKHGFYIIGNASLMRTVNMWDSIVEYLIKEHKIGASFQACCSRHPRVQHEIRQPQDFAFVPVCDIKCGAILPCGHICKDKCHTRLLHDRKLCDQKCSKRHEGCGHPCQRLCGEPCGDCAQNLGLTSLPCGHKFKLTCSEKRKKITPKCEVIIATVHLPCGHHVDRKCGAKDDPVICKESCTTMLNCGHLCSGCCDDCQHQMQHAKCAGQCGQIGECGHECRRPCHDGDCPPCDEICETTCHHGTTTHKCSIVPDPCTQRCNHSEGCSALCCLPCTRTASNNPCTRTLPCGHLCPSLEDELCVQSCSECITGHPCDYLQIYLSCNHSVDVEKLDSFLGLSTLYEISAHGCIQFPKQSAILDTSRTLECPLCGQPVSNIRRYSCIGKLQDLSKSLDALYMTFGRRLNSFMARIFYIRKELKLDRSDFVKRLVPGPLGGMTNKNLVQIRGNRTHEVEDLLLKFRDTLAGFERSLSELVEFVGQDRVAAVIRVPFPAQQAPDAQSSDAHDDQISAAPRDQNRSPIDTSDTQQSEDEVVPTPPVSDTESSARGNFPDTAITREIMREAEEREKAQSSWAVPKKPRPFKARPLQSLNSSGGDFNVASLPFRARLESLFFRCRLIILEEGVYMHGELEKLQPRSPHTSIFLGELRSLIIVHAKDRIENLNAAIVNAAFHNLKRLEVELRLMQVSLHSVLAKFGVISKVNLKATSKILMSLCEQYPNTAGVFLPSCKSIHHAVTNRRQNWNIDLYNKEANAFWQSWAAYEVGFLRHCPFGHPYPGFVFRDCPECGRFVEPKHKEDTRDYSKHLKEQDFLSKMNAMKIWTAATENLPEHLANGAGR